MERAVAIFLKVEIDAGTSVGDAANELTALAAKIGVVVEAELGEAKMFARPFQLATDVLAEYERECRFANYPSLS